MRSVVTLLIVTAVIGGLWYAVQPHTPKKLFEVRCASCHPLPVRALCEYPPELRPAVVETMRTLQGADAEISAAEALQIKQYLKESVLCP